MTLSVIIPAFNHLEDTLVCLNSVQALAQDATPAQYIVSDDCSPDVFYPNMISPRVAQVCRNSVNLGFGTNCNAAAKHAAGDIILFLNQDIQAVVPLSIGWDTALQAAFMYDPQIAIVGARLLFPDGKLQSAGGEFDAKCAPVHRCLGWSNLTHPEISTPMEVKWVTGAALAIRADIFRQVGGFDERYIGGYFEDVALCLKVRELGFKTWYEPRVTFVHKVGSTGGSPHFYENAQLFRKEWVLTNKIQPDLPVATVHYW